MSLKQAIFDPIAVSLRRSKLHLLILKRLLRLDNWLRRWISFFAFEDGKHVKHRLTKYHDFFHDNVTPTDTVLDIGCGGGHVAYSVAQKARQVVGVDIDARYLAPARQYTSQPNLQFIQADATTHQFSEDFDAVILSNVLEHIDDRVGLLKRIKHLAPKFLIRVPMIDRDWIVLLKQELGVEYRLDPTHTTEYTEEQFRGELAAAGFAVHQLHVRFGEIYCIAVTR